MRHQPLCSLGKSLHLPLTLCIFCNKRTEGLWKWKGHNNHDVNMHHLCSRIPPREQTLSPHPAVHEPRSCYPEILQGPERTNVKRAHVTHFYPKNIITDHPNFLSAVELFTTKNKKKKKDLSCREGSQSDVKGGGCGFRRRWFRRRGGGVGFHPAQHQ